MLALTLEQAKTIGIGLAGLFVVGAVLSLWLVTKILKKLLLVVVLMVLAGVVWSQRASLEDCADRVEAEGRTATCTFFGRDVTIDRNDA